MANDTGYTFLQQLDLTGAKVWRSRSRKRRTLLCAATLLGVTSLTLLWMWLSRIIRSRGIEGHGSEPIELKFSPEPSFESLEQCPPPTPLPAIPPAPVNLWASLTVEETGEITEWLLSPSKNLNLTLGDRAQLSDDFIFHIEAYRPLKAEALRYLASPSDRNLPKKYARVTIHHGARNEENGGPVIKDYVVGPLPIDTNTTMRGLTEIYHREEIPFNARMATVSKELTPLLTKIMTPLAEATEARGSNQHVPSRQFSD